MQRLKGLQLAQSCPLLVGTFAGPQPKPFGAFLTQTGRLTDMQRHSNVIQFTQLN
jgi:hypothetical protein